MRAVGQTTLALGGTGTGVIDLGSIGAAQQYRAFEIFEKRESGSWTLTGTNSFQPQNWQLLGGTLHLASGASLAAGSTIENSANAAGPVTLEISGAFLGAGATASSCGRVRQLPDSEFGRNVWRPHHDAQRITHGADRANALSECRQPFRRNSADRRRRSRHRRQHHRAGSPTTMQRCSSIVAMTSSTPVSSAARVWLGTSAQAL